MAARTNKVTHSDNTKGEIKASQLLNRLFMCGNGEIDLTQSQIQSARIFIGKYKADLKAIELTGKDGGPVRVQASALDEKL